MLLAALIPRNGNILIWVVCVLLPIILYFSKPDRGGLQRCERIFGLDALRDLELEQRSLWKWRPFEQAKFSFEVPSAMQQKLLEYLEAKGFRTWHSGGIQYGSFNVGWEPSENVKYSKIERHGEVFVIALDEDKNILYLIKN